MECKIQVRIADERDSQELANYELPERSADSQASCPFMKKVTLLPLRYGRVEVSPEGAHAAMPYDLKSRPMGYRLLRNGYIYIYDESERELKEYYCDSHEIKGGPIEYEMGRTIYVFFSDYPWTNRKKAQISNDPEERHHWMQKVELNSETACDGVKNLLTLDRAEKLVAEFAEDYRPPAIEDGFYQETEPYFWEHKAYYHKTRYGKLIKQQDVVYPEECLCLVLRDDIGVMLDLAEHQDDVVNFLEWWASENENERDYILGTTIEKLDFIDYQALEDQLEGMDEAAFNFKGMSKDLNRMPLEEKQATLKALSAYLNDPEYFPDITPEHFHPDELKNELESLDSDDNWIIEEHGEYMLAHRDKILRAKKFRTANEWYAKRALPTIDNVFVEKYAWEIRYLKNQRQDQVRGLREGGYRSGRGIGSPGIETLIDVTEMERFMLKQRKKLNRWNDLLEKITEDRVNLVIDNLYHRSTWYFDNLDDSQIEMALDLHYMCFRDLCRSDSASEKLLSWMNKYPQYSLPLFHTLSKYEQRDDSELVREILKVASCGNTLVTKSTEMAKKLFEVESRNLPAINQLSEDIQVKARAVGDTMSPAISVSIAESLDALYRDIESDRLPETERIFKRMPFFFKHQMLEAVENGKVEFKISSREEFEAFRRNVVDLVSLQEEMKDKKKERKIEKQPNHGGHKSAKARRLLKEYQELEEEYNKVAKKLAAGLSPVENIGNAQKWNPRSIELSAAEVGRPGITLVVPEDQNREIARLFGHYGLGVDSPNNVVALGDGIGAAVFVTQVVTLCKLVSESYSGSVENAGIKIFESLAGTIGSGFQVAQGIADASLVKRAKHLTEIWDASKLDTINIKLGKLHIFTGAVAYSLAFIGSYSSFLKFHGQLADSVKNGNTKAETGAILGMAGSGGMTIASGAAAVRTVGMGLSVIGEVDEVARAGLWASGGTRLSAMFGRLTIPGMVFTVFELAGTWIYNRYNYNQLDKWLKATPWAWKKERIQLDDDSLKGFQQAFSDIMSKATLDEIPDPDQDSGRLLELTINGLTHTDLADRPGFLPLNRISLSSWVVLPRGRGQMARSQKEKWLPCSLDYFNDLAVRDDRPNLQLTFKWPEEFEQGGLTRTRYLWMMLKIGSLQSNGEYEEDVVNFCIRKGGPFPGEPTDNVPRKYPQSPQFVRIPYPFLGLEVDK